MDNVFTREWTMPTGPMQSNSQTQAKNCNRPLNGITVVSCEQAVAAPFASRQLADLGARVIKIERPGEGDFARGYDDTVRGMSSHFVWLNRGKESLSADLKDSSDIHLVKRIIEQADVFIQNLAPGAIERLGLDMREMRAKNSKLITVSISGYGSEGPYRNAKAYDALIQAETGLMSVTGTEDHPSKTGISTADISAGMYAYTGVLSALYNRTKTGEGEHIEVSLFDSLIEWMGYPLYFSRYSEARPARAGASHAAIAPYGLFATGDETEFMLAIQNDREWHSFASHVLEMPDLATDPRYAKAKDRFKNRRALEETILKAFRPLKGVVVEKRLQQARIAHSQQRDMTDVWNHPQLVERDRWQTIQTPAGPIEAVVPPVIFDSFAYPMGPIPSAGEHTDQIRAEFGEQSS